MPGYAGNTNFIITTDHGRGKNGSAWQRHGAFTPGSGEVWRAYLGPGFAPLGEVLEEMQLQQKELPALVQQLAAAMPPVFSAAAFYR